MQQRLTFWDRLVIAVSFAISIYLFLVGFSHAQTIDADSVRVLPRGVHAEQIDSSHNNRDFPTATAGMNDGLDSTGSAKATGAIRFRWHRDSRNQAPTGNAAARAGVVAPDEAISLVDVEPVADNPLSFTAELSDDMVMLSWWTQPGRKTKGFHIYRSTMPGSGYARVTDEIIRFRYDPEDEFADDGSIDLGQSYFWADVHSMPGQPYYYKLAEIDSGGKETLYGPVKILARSIIATINNPLD